MDFDMERDLDIVVGAVHMEMEEDFDMEKEAYKYWLFGKLEAAEDKDFAEEEVIVEVVEAYKYSYAVMHMDLEEDIAVGEHNFAVEEHNFD